MMTLKWFGGVLLLIVSMFNCSLGAPSNDEFNGPGLPRDGFIGVNIGDSRKVDPKVTVDTLKANKITHLRLFDADARMLNALANTGIEVIVGVNIEEIRRIGSSDEQAIKWINDNVAAHPWVNITAIALGNEVFTSHNENATWKLLDTFKSLKKGLIGLKLDNRVKVSAPQSISLIPSAFPPSLAVFDFSICSKLNEKFFLLLDNLRTTRSYYMLNVYPYYSFLNAKGTFPIDFALFRPVPSVKHMMDPNTHLYYNNMLDVMIDATYNAMANLGFPDIPIVITETGWPWHGEKEPDATKDNAETFNNNLVQRVLNRSRGTPLQPTIPVRAYIYQLFDVGPRLGNWALFSDEGAAVYPLSLTDSSSINGNSLIFCVAKQNIDSHKMKSGLDWVCGQGGANCTAIQEGQPCYFPNTHKDHASFAYNDYYQRTGKRTCDFNGTAVATTIDPSYGFCIFNGSSIMITSPRLSAPPPVPVAFNGSSNTNTSTGNSTPTAGNTSMKVSRFQCLSLISSVSFLALVFL